MRVLARVCASARVFFVSARAHAVSVFVCVCTCLYVPVYVLIYVCAVRRACARAWGRARVSATHLEDTRHAPPAEIKAALAAVQEKPDRY